MSTTRPTSRLRRATRRTAKWTCTILAGVMVMAWVASGWQGFACLHETASPYLQLQGTRGAIFGEFALDIADVTLFDTPRDDLRWDRPFPLPFGRGWEWSPRLHEGLVGGTHFVIPYWIPTLAFAVPATLLWWIDPRRRTAGRVGLCTKCGYSLVGTPATSPCPECGTARA